MTGQPQFITNVSGQTFPKAEVMALLDQINPHRPDNRPRWKRWLSALRRVRLRTCPQCGHDF